jgi:hypothetical protein
LFHEGAQNLRATPPVCGPNIRGHLTPSQCPIQKAAIPWDKQL